MTSADEAAMWRDAVPVPAETAAAVSGRTVLLVVDATASQWPVTVVGGALRAAGATAVLPLLLHRRV